MVTKRKREPKNPVASAWRQVTDEKLCELRLEQKLFERDIAAIYSVTESAVNNRLRKAGITIPPEERKALVRERRMQQKREAAKETKANKENKPASSYQAETPTLRTIRREVKAHPPTKARPVVSPVSVKDIVALSRELAESKQFPITKCDTATCAPEWPQYLSRQRG